ncbi:MAG: asparagine synthase (glutamine-hydrolyzing) [Verrucomicrobiaceae bacterium]|nr:asparagine synthase (glutamine-hydrolyzing) [Verrucomicrobiaceae bacterium]
MCGFLGWFRSSSNTPWREDARVLQARALAAITHRGPDDGAEAISDHGWMGFRRLSILDLSEHGRQPMHFGGTRFTLTFNGEIYNFRDLRATLGGAGLGSTGDTAVLGTLMERDGIENTLPRLRGMFALSWWDAEQHTLVLARDHFGIKPLYYRLRDDGTLLYGSELRAIAMLDGAAQVSQTAVAQFLRWGAVQAPETMFEGVRCLPPGHLLTWKDGRIELNRWFEPRWTGKDAWITDPAERWRCVRECVQSSVAAHLVADVPVGVFLSGGLDSTLMAACMRAAGQERVKAFSIGYEENAGVPDETDAAERSARFLGCEFVRERISGDSLAAMLDDYFDQMDQPTGDGLNTWLVSRVAAREVKVALGGLGADEWWAGYNYHRLVALAARSPLHAAGGLARGLDAMLPQSVRGHRAWKAAFYALGGAGGNVAAWHAHARTIIPSAEVAQLLRVEGKMYPVAMLSPHAPDSWLHELLLRETETYLANTLLRDNDVTSMAHSLELRVPLVDREVFDLAGKIPPEAKLTPLGGKRILREAFRDLLPPWIYEDRQKKTFTLPLMKWMRTPQWQARIRETLSSQRCRERGLIDASETSKMCDAYFSSRLDSKAAWPLSQRVWMLYVLEEWARRNTEVPA